MTRPLLSCLERRCSPLVIGPVWVSWSPAPAPGGSVERPEEPLLHPRGGPRWPAPPSWSCST